MRGGGDACGSQAGAVSWSRATWRPRPDMGSLSRPSSSASHGNLPVRVEIQESRGPDRVQHRGAVPTPLRFSNLFTLFQTSREG